MIERQITTEVNMRQGIGVSINASPAYATSDDFCQIFTEEMNSLYLLALLLTADPGKAEQCFVAGIGNSVEGNPVFREWARSWARRTIIQHAIRMIKPAQERLTIANTEPVRLKIEPRLAAILELDALERFVFVVSVLEGYSHQDCCVLLGCSRQTAVEARSRALQQLASVAQVVAIHGAEVVAPHREELQNTYALVSN
jgi:DNA-directed RNA polymerase specialized sigma24 family protein